eukprot:CAMPEP_0181294592 /NCGR_PEP_ID=MMETSP1101-20121128/3690_1 /TAXON_ID=46948 /ORGANISM="Rhodomonas abbreviata, Strain Caron Lab Isolate" /LENGTH=105 /DNA_ID=CAMNT_0023399275 /DNA_START=102 /DNA_END=415 /DNA_ORIENTATION=+
MTFERGKWSISTICHNVLQRTAIQNSLPILGQVVWTPSSRIPSVASQRITVPSSVDAVVLMIIVNIEKVSRRTLCAVDSLTANVAQLLVVAKKLKHHAAKIRVRL